MSGKNPENRKKIDLRKIVIAALAGRSVSWLAAESGVPQPRLSVWLAGRQTTITSGHIERVLAALDLRIVASHP